MSTFPVSERLEAFALTLEPAGRDAVRAEVEAVVREADAFVFGWRKPIGLDDPERLEIYMAAMRAHMTARHPWLSEAAWGRLRAFNGYMIWHEGL